MKTTEISKEALGPIVTARAKAIELARVADQALKDARVAELEFKVQLQQLYIEHGLETKCSVDITTGKVGWPEEPQEPQPEVSDDNADANSKKTKRALSKKTETKVV